MRRRLNSQAEAVLGLLGLEARRTGPGEVGGTSLNSSICSYLRKCYLCKNYLFMVNATQVRVGRRGSLAVATGRREGRGRAAGPGAWWGHRHAATSHLSSYT